MTSRVDEAGPSEQQRKASAAFEVHMAKFMAKKKDDARLDNEARAKARGPTPPPPTRADLEQQLSDAKKRHQTLGGSDWQYADSNQNMTPREREARKLESTIIDLGRQVRQRPNDGDGYAKGGRINLSHCSVSTTPKGKKNSSW